MSKIADLDHHHHGRVEPEVTQSEQNYPQRLLLSRPILMKRKRKSQMNGRGARTKS